MTALSQDRDTKIKDGVMLSLGRRGAATKIYAGALVALNATGYATKARPPPAWWRSAAPRNMSTTATAPTAR